LHLCVAPSVASGLFLSNPKRAAPHFGQSRHDIPESHLPCSRCDASIGVDVLKQRGQATTSTLEVVHLASEHRRETQRKQKKRFE